MTAAFLNRIAKAVPPHEVHGVFLRFARALLAEERKRRLFDRMADKCGISRRFSVLQPEMERPDSVDATRLFERGNFAGTGRRMATFEQHAPTLATEAVQGLDLSAAERQSVTHVIVTSCTGMYAPGIDWDLIGRCGLRTSVERTAIGFMGCFAAVNGLKLARHIVRSEPDAKVLMVNLELCTLHLHETHSIEEMLSFLVFGDGCAASLVSREPMGLRLDAFHSALIPDSADLITWRVRDLGFDMFLSGQVPTALRNGLAQSRAAILGAHPLDAITHFAVHPGGRTVLDAVEHAFELPAHALAPSRAVLEGYGNMSSASVMFVLESILRTARSGERGCAMSFGPGLTAETFQFEAV